MLPCSGVAVTPRTQGAYQSGIERAAFRLGEMRPEILGFGVHPGERVFSELDVRSD